MDRNDATHPVSGTLHLPDSSFLDAQTLAALHRPHNAIADYDAARQSCPPYNRAQLSKAASVRHCQAEAFYKTVFYKTLRDRYPVIVTSTAIAGVNTEVFTPLLGVAQKNKNRVLINLHGGGFYFGARTHSHMESIPIASVGHIKVISVDYRMLPEHTFPAASEDAVAVYRELLKTYPAKNIGIYGCSAGGLATAQAVALIQKSNLPRPGAVGMFCAAASYYEGDSAYFGAAQGAPLEQLVAPLDPDRFPEHAYYTGVNLKDPMVFPVRSPEIMAEFPPSLLLVSTRDFTLSSVVYTHSVLVARGVPAELHVWEGLYHSFLIDPELPQSREAYDVIVRFFDSWLGR